MLKNATTPEIGTEMADADNYTKTEQDARPSARLELLENVLEAKSIKFYYGNSLALKNISISIPKKRVTAFIGPSGCGKSTLLRCFNRMNDLIDIARLEGQILFQGQDIYSSAVNVTELRRHVGMVFQKSNPFPKSIYENVAFGLRIHGVKKKSVLDAAVEKSLKSVALWGEVADRLDDSALALSGGQQQRLCIARAIATEPEVLLMDEPCSALDPVATSKIEELIDGLKEQYTIVIVTHNMQQATRVSDTTAFLLQGDLIEYGATEEIFQRPKDKRTDDYIRGKFG